MEISVERGRGLDVRQAPVAATVLAGAGRQDPPTNPQLRHD